MALVKILNARKGQWYQRYNGGLFSVEKIDDFYRVDSGLFEGARINPKDCKKVVNFKLEKIKKILKAHGCEVRTKCNGQAFEIYRDKRFYQFAFSVECLINICNRIKSIG